MIQKCVFCKMNIVDIMCNTKSFFSVRALTTKSSTRVSTGVHLLNHWKYN